MSGFKNFILRGSLVDIAVAFIMATAFGKVVTTFVSWLTAQLPESAMKVFKDVPNSFGAFLNAVISFLLIAAAVFFFVIRPLNAFAQRMRKDPSPDPTTRKCPECLSEIPVAARRCAFCTSEVNAPA